jgi:hypothetical protein
MGEETLGRLSLAVRLRPLAKIRQARKLLNRAELKSAAARIYFLRTIGAAGAKSAPPVDCVVTMTIGRKSGCPRRRKGTAFGHARAYQRRRDLVAARTGFAMLGKTGAKSHWQDETATSCVPPPTMTVTRTDDVIRKHGSPVYDKSADAS